MIKRLAGKLLRFRRDEDGSALVVEFVIFVPLLFGAFLMAAEMGIYSMRQMFLDRGLDLAVRHVRLNTNEPLTHRQLKDMVCEYSGFLPDCDNTLRLEMTPVDPRQFASLPPLPDCVDVSEPISPVRGFILGQEQQIMLLRACVKFKPMYPTTGLGFAWDKDGSGRARMVSMAAFVQEPG